MSRVAPCFRCSGVTMTPSGRSALALALMMLVHGPAVAQVTTPQRMYGEVAINSTTIAFSFAGQIWEVSRAGGTARRLTTSAEDHSFPVYSPDGTRLAFTRGTSLYVMPAGGGEPKRLTWFPRTPYPRAWTPDGKMILYCAARDGDGNMRALLVPADGGPETLLPLNPVRFASYSPDGKRLALVGRTIFLGGVDRRFYRGGMRDPLEIVDVRACAEPADDRAGGRVPVRLGPDEEPPVVAGRRPDPVLDLEGGAGAAGRLVPEHEAVPVDRDEGRHAGAQHPAQAVLRRENVGPVRRGLVVPHQSTHRFPPLPQVLPPASR